jgi:hypothetical protein
MRSADTDDAVNYFLPDYVIAGASKCPRAAGGKQPFPCQKDPSICCRVLSEVGESFVFIDSKYRGVCTYLFDFGGRECCSCPVRVQLWNRYNV